jgi:hypothetical protein
MILLNLAQNYAMTWSEIVSVTGLPGLYKVLASRKDGLIVSSIAEGGSRFVASRQHMFSTLDNITIYTTAEEPAALKEVFRSMHSHGSCPDAKESESQLRDYLKKVLPDYDEEKVYVSDIRKLLKWYHLLNEKKMLEELLTEASAEETPALASVAEVSASEEKPVKKSAKKKAATADEAQTEVASEEKPKAKRSRKTAE